MNRKVRHGGAGIARYKSPHLTVGSYLFMSPSLRAEHSVAKSLLKGTGDQTGVEVPMRRFFAIALNDNMHPGPLPNDPEGAKRIDSSFTVSYMKGSVIGKVNN